MLIGGILGYVFRSKVLGSLEQEMKTSMTHYDRIKYREAWDATQRTVSPNLLFIFYLIMIYSLILYK